MSKRKLSRQQQWRIEKVQAERTKRAEKRETQDRDKLDAGEYGPEQHGRVIAHYGRSLEVESESGSLHRCHLRANLETLVTGDRVIWREASDASGVVVARGARTTELERPDMRGVLKPVAANIDQILIVFAAEPAPQPNLIDRYLIAAEATGITPVLVLNKVDLLPESGGELRDLLARYEALGYEVVACTTRGESGLDALKAQLSDRTSVFVGQSGVGKSSLIGMLLPREEVRVGPLSAESRQGMHTTTTAWLYHMPDGGDLIDSPGIREFGLVHLTPEQVTDGFREFHDYLGYCRFRDCKHEKEPGCALLKAVDNGEIGRVRFESYKKILLSLTES
ncbi:small ribosomal subunit biogenesis GTPase RsgA [Cobetia sp. LC6]|uniref:small ribosomal subunit biogenesis GTPase RsgA n=1 Tax=Cobetia TaxID=204286 RepID=UPI002552EEC2|nr:small ribosomal subunit biogenesis GTPase RsgA [Cobetia sp. LC6]MDL2190178.1 small ribosomal subunit biogenesis GTPase RsgA [Cobetia sp. LC6]